MTSEIIVELPSELYQSLDTTFEMIESQRSRRANPDVIELLLFHSGRLKVEIFANEHPPPHFRVRFKNKTANFRIKDCAALNGDVVVLRNMREIEKWWREHKQVLIDTWNKSRPADCSVGQYVES
jgi:hypothetical protein